MKNYVGIARDHSGSMSSFKRLAMADYNGIVEDLHRASETHKIDTIVNTVTFGINSQVKREAVNSSVHAIQPLSEYRTDGGTPLYDAVGELIELLEKVPDYDDSSATFLVMVVTDGAENQSRKWSAGKLAAKINALQRTDRWTFTFRTPRGYANTLISNLGIPQGNVMDWDTSEKGFQQATVATRSAVGQFYQQRASGQTRSTSFYADLSHVSISEAKRALQEVSQEVVSLRVAGINPLTRKSWMIKDFVEDQGYTYQLGKAFYQLTKNEKEVQSHKKILVRHRVSGKVYAGSNARTMLGLPTGGTVRLNPGNHGEWDIFIQSTSVNRNLVSGTDVLWWERVRDI